MQTYEEILDRMLDRVPDTIDKREGSIIYDALAPTAAELQLAYIELDYIINEAYADTASRENLVRRAKERGLKPKSAGPAIVKAEFSKGVEIGARFSLEELNYVAIEKISGNQYKLRCEQSGAVGNRSSGDLIPIEYIEGLEYARIIEILIHGEEEEETEVFRARYFESFSAQAFGGNIADYKAKVKAINGVGGVKVIPAWNGPGTVKLIAISSNYDDPTNELIKVIKTNVDPEEFTGKGYGFAPIGHKVTVEGVASENINIRTAITCQPNWSFEDSKSYIERAVDRYFLELAKTWEDESQLVVRISQLETRILNVDGVLDVQNTTLNGIAGNIVLEHNQIPKRGEIEWIDN